MSPEKSPKSLVEFVTVISTHLFTLQSTLFFFILYRQNLWPKNIWTDESVMMMSCVTTSFGRVVMKIGHDILVFFAIKLRTSSNLCIDVGPKSNKRATKFFVALSLCHSHTKYSTDGFTLCAVPTKPRVLIYCVTESITKKLFKAE